MHKLQAPKVFTDGIAIGKIFLVKEVEYKIADYRVESEADKTAEVEKFMKAVEKVSANLAEIASENPIFAGHLAIVSDFTLHDSVKQKIQAGDNAESATQASIAELKAVFESMDDAYMKERAADMVDVGEQLIAALQNRDADKFASLKERSVIIARDLYPSDTAQLDLSKVAGFITEEGGVTSHVSIMAKGMGIPALVGVKGILEATAKASQVVFNAATGEIFIDPDADFIAEYSEKQAAEEKERADLLAKADQPATTVDGHTVKVYANVGNVDDISKAVDKHCRGVGLFRTEFLYMENDHFPDEEEQYKVYSEACKVLGGEEMIVRTLDIGGDKTLSYYTFDFEENPFLGYRAIRMCLDQPEILLTQFKALLRAAVDGKIKIMLPMLISLSELSEAKKLLAQAKDELEQAGVAYSADVELGMMIETPAAVLQADDFAKEVDFFSIGTNDLTQYVLAVDRGNKKINHLYNSFHPAVLRAIKEVIDAGHRAGIEVGMCGEFASDDKAAKVLLGMGLDEFSMASGSTPKIKQLVRESNYSDLAAKVEQVLKLATAEEVLAEIANW